MGGNAHIDYKDFKKMIKKLEKKNKEVPTLAEKLTKQLTARLLTKVIKRTPVGKYKKGSGKVGGNLRRGWTGGKKIDPLQHVATLKLKRVGNTYSLSVINNVEYSAYVEFGHRTRNHKGWVKGRFMLTISEDEIEKSAPKIIEKEIKTFLEDTFK